MTNDETMQLVERLANSNGSLQRELAAARVELNRLRKSRHLAHERHVIRAIRKAGHDAHWLCMLHLAGLQTGRRARDVHAMARWRHESALALLRLGRVYGARGFVAGVDVDTLAQGVERGLAAALANPDRWRMRLPKHRLLG